MKKVVLILFIVMSCFYSYSQIFKQQARDIISNDEYLAVVKAFEKLGSSEKVEIEGVILTKGELYLDITTIALNKLTDQLIHIRFPFKEKKELDIISRVCVVSYLRDLSTCGVWIFNTEGKNNYMTIDHLASINDPAKFGEESWFKQVKSFMVNMNYGWNYLIYMNGILGGLEKPD